MAAIRFSASQNKDCRIQKILLSNFGFDRAANEPRQVCSRIELASLALESFLSQVKMQLDMPFLTFNDDPELSLKAQQAIEQGFAQTAGGSAMVILFHPEDTNSVFEKENSELVISSRGAPVHVYNVSALEVLATADKRTDSTIVHVFAQGCHDWTAFDDLFNSGVHSMKLSLH